jgi:hypothetical protein
MTVKSVDNYDMTLHNMPLKDLCQMFGMKLTTVLSRINLLGMSVGEALTTPLKGAGKGKVAHAEAKKVIMYGQRYTIGELARAYRIPETTLRDRLARGMSPHVAVLKGLGC